MRKMQRHLHCFDFLQSVQSVGHTKKKKNCRQEGCDCSNSKSRYEGLQLDKRTNHQFATEFLPGGKGQQRKHTTISRHAANLTNKTVAAGERASCQTAASKGRHLECTLPGVECEMEGTRKVSSKFGHHIAYIRRDPELVCVPFVARQRSAKPRKSSSYVLSHSSRRAKVRQVTNKREADS